MSWNGSPGAGGGGGTGGGPAVPVPQPAQPARCTAPGTTRATLNTHALKVWLQAVDPLSPDCNDANGMAEGIQTRLQSIFDLVAARPGQPNAIQVIWTLDISSEPVGTRDIVIYFSDWYTTRGGTTPSSRGVVNRYLQERARQTTGDLRQIYQELRRVHITSRSTPSEGGLCVADTDNTPPVNNGTSVSEVFTDIMLRAMPSIDQAANRSELLRTRYGFGLAGMAYHEAMHDKIDPFQGEGWDLHSSGGGGLARGNLGWNDTHTQRNIDLMAQRIYQTRHQYILPAAAPTTPTPAPTPAPTAGP
ncbi:MAG: hypothetical protein PVJ57_04645 [Phycisphaerae bacterium]|jgi:hypothetical protein